MRKYMDVVPGPSDYSVCHTMNSVMKRSMSGGALPRDPKRMDPRKSKSNLNNTHSGLQKQFFVDQRILDDVIILTH